MKLFYGHLVVGTIEEAFVSDGTWFGEFLPEPQAGREQAGIRVSEFIKFCQDWHDRLAKGADPDATEFEQFADLISSGLWHVRTTDGSDQAIVEAPVFTGTEITWRTAVPEELEDELHARIVSLSEEANALQGDGRWEDAIAKFQEALTLVPEPKYKWEAGTWLFVAIGDAAFQAGQYERAREAFREAMLCPGAIGNPFVHLRRGQTFFELGEMQRAEEELTGAYMLEGKEIFAQEDPKYFERLKTVLGGKIPS